MPRQPKYSQPKNVQRKNAQLKSAPPKKPPKKSSRPKRPGPKALPLTLDELRRRAVAASLFAPTTLAKAVTALGFVQADPIRSPARAQDLILRQRVANYRAGDLERRYARLGLEEDFLYAYGFMPREVADLLHPRGDAAGALHRPSGLAADVLGFVAERGRTHPQDLIAHFGKERAVNGWGGFSQATTRALQHLHHYGHLRVAKRRDGIRIYEAAPGREPVLDAAERRRRILLLVTRLLAPLPVKGLRPTLALLSRGASDRAGLYAAVQAMLRQGELESGKVGGETYLWPAAMDWQKGGEARRKLRFLAPFDPIVWDRRRFEHLFGWEYRFEAYTPDAKRKLGYYAMPLLYAGKAIGWVNLKTASGRLEAEPGFVRAAPKGQDFRRAFDAEMARMEVFLGLGGTG
jgi:uncharacterized protein YcaQ